MNIKLIALIMVVLGMSSGVVFASTQQEKEAEILQYRRDCIAAVNSTLKEPARGDAINICVQNKLKTK